MRKTLQHQLEKIMDETEGVYTDVIVQFSSDNDGILSDLIEAAVETERNRAMIVNPTYILPADSNAFDGSPAARKKLRNNQGNLLANILLQSSKYETALKAAAEVVAPALNQTITDFLGSSTVTSAVATIQQRLRGKADEATPQALPNIGGARMMVNRGDLPKIIREQHTNLDGVYENATIKAPRIAKSNADELGHDANNYDAATWGLVKSNALAAWSTFQNRGTMANGQKVKVAVLDTGADPNHPDLKGRMHDFAEFDRAGRIVAQGLASARDSGQHGTHVAGTIVGGNASGTWIGMAPDAEFIAGLVLNGSAGGSLAQVISGIDWAVSSGAQIINMSLGGLTFSSSVGTPYQRAIVNALARGSLVVAAIGNDGHQTTGAPGNDYFSLAIGAHDIAGRCAGFSGGRTHELNQSNYIDARHLPLVYSKPDLSAPGVLVKSSIPGNDWAYFNGTSMATPHVAGAAALLIASTGLADQPSSQRAFLARDLLLGGVSDFGEAGQDQRFGYGMLNILKSIDEAKKRGF